MKYIFAIIITILAISSLQAQPQQKGPHPPRIPSEEQVQKMIDELANELNLNEVEKDKVSSLYLTHFEEVKEERAKTMAIMEKKKESMNAKRDEFEASVIAEIGEEKEDAYLAFLYKKRAERKGKSGSKRGPREEKKDN